MLRHPLVGSCTEPVVGYASVTYRAARRMSAETPGIAMAVRTMNSQTWQKLTEVSEAQRAQLLGWSPGGAAAQLGISRQAVHKAIHRGDLDAVIVNNEDGKLSMFMIPDASLQAFKAKRMNQKRTG